MSNEHELGYLRNQTERNYDAIQELKEELRNHLQTEENDLKELNQKFDELNDLVLRKFHTAEMLAKIGKFIFLAVIAILSFKFGDISRLWAHIFG